MTPFNHIDEITRLLKLLTIEKVKNEELEAQLVEDNEKYCVSILSMEQQLDVYRTGSLYTAMRERIHILEGMYSKSVSSKLKGDYAHDTLKEIIKGQNTKIDDLAVMVEYWKTAYNRILDKYNAIKVRQGLVTGNNVSGGFNDAK